MNTELYAAQRLTRLGAKSRAVLVELQDQPEEKKPSALGKVAKGLGAAAIIGGVGYGAASYLRGRKIMSPVGGGIGGHLSVLKAGNAANIADAGQFLRTSGAKVNAIGKTAVAKSDELRRRLAASLANGRNVAAGALATTPIKPTYAID
jgi:hypothetical protein